jgi:hypothetical protein
MLGRAVEDTGSRSPPYGAILSVHVRDGLCKCSGRQVVAALPKGHAGASEERACKTVTHVSNK